MTQAPKQPRPKPTSERTRAEFDTFWETFGVGSGNTFALGDTQTLRPKTQAADVARMGGGDDGEALPRLPRLLSSRSLRDTLPELELKGTLGQGGMGVVSLATQVPLGRDVAVKALREDRRGSDAATLVLLREGWVTGVLEHPNIVPIYQLGRDEQGDPLIVMKRIEGVSWAELIRDPSASPRAFDSDDPLDWHLEILQQVCNAVHFAHAKGIIHRDLKPENVMIGAFGEVYLVDWGIAVSLDEQPDGRIPTVADVSGPAGTPAYMAPEMVGSDGGALGVRTDVYLLGAVLHEVLTGSPPHAGENLYELMFDAFQSRPKDYPDQVPGPLAQICRKAMAAEPAERHASAEAFRQALADYARHRESERLADEAAERLGDLRVRIEGAGGGHGHEEEAQAAIYSAFGQCRFGFEQALQVDADNGRARQGLQAALELMARRELDRDAYQAAAILIADLPEPRPELDRRLEALARRLEDRDEEFERLQRIGRAVDIEVGRASRSIFALVMGAIWGALSLLTPTFIDLTGVTIDSHGLLIHGLAVFALFTGGVAIARRRLLQNAANRRLIFGVNFLLFGALVLRAMAAVIEMTVPVTFSFEILMYGIGGSAIAIALDRRLLWGSLPYMPAAILGLLFPSHIYTIFGVTNLLAMSLLAWAWWPRKSAR